MSEEPTYEEGEAPKEEKKPVVEKPVTQDVGERQPNGEEEHPYGPPLDGEDPKKLKWERKDERRKDGV